MCAARCTGKHVWLLATENTTESSNPFEEDGALYIHFRGFVTGNLHRYADRKVWITATCLVQCNSVMSGFVPDCE